MDKFDWGFGCFLLSHVIYMATFGMSWTLRFRPLALYLLTTGTFIAGYQIGAIIYGPPAIFYVVINIMYARLFFLK